MDESGEKVMLLPLVQVIRKSEHGKVLTPFVVYLGAFRELEFFFMQIKSGIHRQPGKKMP